MLCILFIYVLSLSLLYYLVLAVLWSPAGKVVTVCDVSLCFCHFPHQMLYLIVSIPDLCIFLYF